MGGFLATVGLACERELPTALHFARIHFPFVFVTVLPGNAEKPTVVGSSLLPQLENRR